MSNREEPPSPHASSEEATVDFRRDPAVSRGLQLRKTQTLIGLQIGHYRLKSKIGQGGGAFVYQAEDLRSGELFALKLLRMAQREQEANIARFQREAVVLEKLDHPHIVRLFDSDYISEEEGFYLVTELLTGQTFKQLLAAGEPIEIPRLAQIVEQICSALHHAHQQGIFHRDIKPSNIFLERAQDGQEQVKIIDFGVAGFTEADGRLTQTGAHIGTPYYMSPEQAIGQAKDATAPSDLYSLAVVLFELLTGSLPFESSTLVGMIFHHAYTPPPLLSQAAPDRLWSPALDAFLQRALAKAPAQRPQDAMAFARECLEGLADQARLTHPQEQSVEEPVTLDQRVSSQEELESTESIGDLEELMDPALDLEGSTVVVSIDELMEAEFRGGSDEEEELIELDASDIYLEEEPSPTQQLGPEVMERALDGGKSPFLEAAQATQELELEPEEELPLVVGSMVEDSGVRHSPLSAVDAFAVGDEFQTDFSLSALQPEDFALLGAMEPGDVTLTGAPATVAPQGQQLLDDIVETDVKVLHRTTAQGPLALCRSRRHSLPEGLGETYRSTPTREEDLAQIHRRFSAGAQTLCLTGPHGVGKTTSMVQYGRMSLDEYPGGVWYCDLSSTHDDGLQALCRLMSEALAVPLTQDNDVIQIGNAIYGRGRCLILLDHTVGQEGYLSQAVALWTRRAPEACFLFASHAPPAEANEETLALGPLPTEEALQLVLGLIEPATLQRYTTPATLDLLRQLVASLGGHAHAMALLAGSLDLLAPDAIQRAMEVAPQAAPASQLLTMLWPRLTAYERDLLLLCMAFGGCASLGNIERSCASHQGRAAATIAGLVRRGLLDEFAYDGLTRIRVPDVVAQFIRHETEMHPAALDEHQRQCVETYAAAGSLDAIPRLWPGQAVGLWHRQIERRERIKALEWSLQQGLMTQASQIYLGLLPVFEARGPFQEAIELGKMLLHHEYAHELSASHRAALQWAISSLYLLTHQVPPSREWLKEAKESASAARHIPIHGLVLTLEGDLMRHQQQPQEARQCYHEALQLHLREDCRNGLFAAHTKCRIGLLHAESGQSEQCVACFEEAYGLYSQGQFKRYEGQIFGLWGNYSAFRGRHSEALEFYAQALALAQEQDDWQLETTTLYQQGRSYTEQGRLEDALLFWEETLAIHRFLGNRKEECELLGLVGRICLQRQQSQRAIESFKQAIQVAREISDQSLLAFHHGLLGELMLAMQETASAREHLNHAVLLLRNLKAPQEGIYLGALAELFLGQGDAEQAADYLTRAERILRGSGLALDMGRLLCRRALFAFKMGHPENAQQALAEAHAIATQHNAAAHSPLMRAIQKLQQFGQSAGA